MNEDTFAFKLLLWMFAYPAGLLILLSPFAVILWLGWIAVSRTGLLPEPWPNP